MTRDIIALNDFIVLIEQSTAEETIIDKCGFEDEVIGIAFYGSGNVLLSINQGDEKRVFNNTKGFAMSFFVNDKVEFVSLPLFLHLFLCFWNLFCHQKNYWLQ